MCSKFLDVGYITSTLATSEMANRVTLILSLAILLLNNPFRCLGLTKPSAVKLENNEYSGVVIAIHHSEPENEDLIDEIIVSTKSRINNHKHHLILHRTGVGPSGLVLLLGNRTLCRLNIAPKRYFGCNFGI